MFKTQQLIQLCAAVVYLGMISLSSGDRCSSVQPSAGRAWLETLRTFTAGQARAISLTFCSEAPVELQFWTQTSGEWSIVWKKEVRGSGRLGEPVVIDIPSEEKLDINADYRLGLWAVDGGDIPVAAIFDPSLPQSVISDNSGPFIIQNAYTFSDIPRPYRFDVNFCMETGCTSVVEPLNPGRRAQPPPTESPKPSNTVTCDENNLYQPQGKILLDRVQELPTGELRAFSFHECDTSPFSLLVWRQETGSYKLIWRKSVAQADFGQASGNKRVISLHADERVLLEEGDRYGLFTESDRISVYHKFASGPRVLLSSKPGLVDLCSPGDFDSLDYPLDFSIQLCNNTGCGLLGVSQGSSGAEICPNDKIIINGPTLSSVSGENEDTDIDETPAAAGASEEQAFNGASRVCVQLSCLRVLSLVILSIAIPLLMNSII